MEKLPNKIAPEIIAKRFPFLEKELYKELSEHGVWYSFDEGEDLIKEENYIKSFPLIMDGIVKVFRMDEDRRENLLYYLKKGQVCSMALSCCMSSKKSSVNVVAETDADVLMIPISYLDDWITKYQTWKIFVMHAFKERFDELLETIDGLAFKKMDERIISFFTEYQKITGKTNFTGTHEEISNALTSSREVVSRILKVMEKKEMVKLSRNKVDFSNLL